MRTLSNKQDVAEMRQRVAAVKPEDARRWGTMTAGEMVCHVRGAFRMALGKGVFAPVRQRLSPTVIKALALWMPIAWPHSMPTVAELERGKTLVEPGGFAEDHAALIAEFEAFAGDRENRTAHPMFGVMSPREWMRWGYLHTDHHLRQFGR